MRLAVKASGERAIWESDFDFDYHIDCADESTCDEKPELPGRPYCANANCRKLKGSKKGRFFPDAACLRCGCTETVLRNAAGKTIGWKKWIALQNAKEQEKVIAENSDYYSQEYY
jgi:hypothetical protein